MDTSHSGIWADLSICLIFLQLKAHSSAIDVFLSETDVKKKKKKFKIKCTRLLSYIAQKIKIKESICLRYVKAQKKKWFLLGCI